VVAQVFGEAGFQQAVGLAEVVQHQNVFGGNRAVGFQFVLPATLRALARKEARARGFNGHRKAVARDRLGGICRGATLGKAGIG